MMNMSWWIDVYISIYVNPWMKWKNIYNLIHRSENLSHGLEWISHTYPIFLERKKLRSLAQQLYSPTLNDINHSVLRPWHTSTKRAYSVTHKLIRPDVTVFYSDSVNLYMSLNLDHWFLPIWAILTAQNHFGIPHSCSIWIISLIVISVYLVVHTKPNSFMYMHHNIWDNRNIVYILRKQMSQVTNQYAFKLPWKILGHICL